MILYVDNPNYYTNTHTHNVRTNKFSKVARYKIKTQKSVAFLYSNNEQSEKIITSTIPFAIALKRMKYSEINLIKETRDLYTTNHKILLKEIRKDINK